MSVEQRVRAALLEDARHLEVPPAPPVSDLLHSPGRSRSVVGVAVAAAALLVIFAVADWAGPSRLEIGPADEADGERSDTLVSYDGRDVFASGVTDGGVDWTGAADVSDHLPCIGIQIRGPGVAEAVAGCSPVRPGTAVRLAAATPTADRGVVAVAGWVSDEVARLVWSVPEGAIELDLHTKQGLPVRLFAGAAHVDAEPTMIEAFDTEGDRLAIVNVAGSSNAEGPDPTAGPTAAGDPTISSSAGWRTLATGTVNGRLWTLDARRRADDLCLRYRTEGNDGPSGSNCAPADPGDRDQHVHLDFPWTGPRPLIGHVSRTVATMELRYVDGPPSPARFHRSDALGAAVFVIEQDPDRERTLLIARDASGTEVFRVDIGDAD